MKFFSLRCPYCSKGFADNSDLKRHKQIHESTPGFIPIRPKEVSSTAASTPVLLSTNAVVASDNASIYSTGKSPEALGVVAGTSFIKPAVDNSFVKTGENSFIKKKSEHRFPCNKCGKVFTRKSHLTRHKLTHDQVKIYCDCGRMFRQKAHLQAHLPACKRKRDAVEAKYLASEHNSMLKNTPPEKSTSSPPTSNVRSDDELPENQKVVNNNNVRTMHNNENTADTSSSDKTHTEQNGVPLKKEMDLSFNFNPLPAGIPALIRDPA